MYLEGSPYRSPYRFAYRCACWSLISGHESLVTPLSDQANASQALCLITSTITIFCEAWLFCTTSARGATASQLDAPKINTMECVLCCSVSCFAPQIEKSGTSNVSTCSPERAITSSIAGGGCVNSWSALLCWPLQSQWDAFQQYGCAWRSPFLLARVQFGAEPVGWQGFGNPSTCISASARWRIELGPSQFESHMTFLLLLGKLWTVPVEMSCYRGVLRYVTRGSQEKRPRKARTPSPPQQKPETKHCGRTQIRWVVLPSSSVPRSKTSFWHAQSKIYWHAHDAT